MSRYDLKLEFTKDSNILIVEPHPDDACLSCHGLIMYCKSIGANITVYTVTKGEAAYGYISKDLAKRRMKETNAYVNAYKLEHVQDDFIDSQISAQDALKDFEHVLSARIAKVIDSKAITHVFMPSYSDRHLDHAYVSLATTLAIARYSEHSRHCTRHFAYDSTTPLESWTHYLVIDNPDEKTEAFDYYTSQVKLCPHFKDGFKGLAAYRGMQVSAYNNDISYAEVYYKIERD